MHSYGCFFMNGIKNTPISERYYQWHMSLPVSRVLYSSRSDDHLSRMPVAWHLKRPNPGAERAAPLLLYSVLLQVGFTEPASRLTAGELLPHLSTLACAFRRPSAVCLCGTFLGVASTGYYPAPCPVELGLSSGIAFRHSCPRSPGMLMRLYLLYIIFLL